MDPRYLNWIGRIVSLHYSDGISYTGRLTGLYIEEVSPDNEWAWVEIDGVRKPLGYLTLED